MATTGGDASVPSATSLIDPPAQRGKIPVIPVDVKVKHEQRPVDFSSDENVKQHMRPWKWLSVNLGAFPLARLNWVVSLCASIFLWAFVIASLLATETKTVDGEETTTNKAFVVFGRWMTWIAQNFAWLYIGTQNVWTVFVVYMGVSRFGNLKLGKDHEKPVFNDMTWFSMLFCSGIGIGLYMYGVSEPMYYYRGYGSLYKIPWSNDDQFAQQALFITLYHWGLHAWSCYILVALTLGFVAYRWDLPMTMRNAFFPLLGDVVNGLFGDWIDFVSMACTTFGVCTSLGMGVDIVFTGFRRLDCGHSAICVSDIPKDDGSKSSRQWKAGIICIITLIATISVVTGLDRGLKRLSQLTFGLGNLLLFSLVYLDNTWYLLNSYVQSLGHYITYVIQVGFQCDTFETLGLEFKAKSELWDQAGFKDGTWTNKVYGMVKDTLGAEAAGNMTSASSVDYGSHASWFIEWWTIFYWGWWISWAPFVGMFIATISRGRTIRQVVVGAFLAPIVYSFFFLVVLGSLGIKMQRVAEKGLDAVLTGSGGTLDHMDKMDVACSTHYSGDPTSSAAIALATQGYFATQCRAHNDRFWDVLMPYGEEIYYFLGVVSFIGVVFYFITSSDSGSFVDDTLSAGGLMHGPVLQRIYWAVTEGACAIALMYGGGSNALKALRAVSIASGLPLTFAICFMCASLHRACKFDLGEADITSSTRFITGLFDWTEGFAPAMPTVQEGVTLPTVSERATSLLISIFAPFVTLHDMNSKLFGNGLQGFLLTGSTFVLFCAWIGCMLGELNAVNASYVGWVCYTTMALIIGYTKIKAREAYNVYGFWMEDCFAALVMYPFVCSQLSLQAKFVPGAPPVDIYADPNAGLYGDAVVEDEKPAQATTKPPPGQSVQHPLQASGIAGEFGMVGTA